MTKMSKRELSEIISRDKPGYEIVEHLPKEAEPDSESEGTAPVTDRVMDLDELRRRYLGDGAAADPPAADAFGDTDDTPDADIDDSSDDEDEIVVLNPAVTNADPWAPGPGRKSVIVSGKERRVIAEQG
jgi:hypothetical protein